MTTEAPAGMRIGHVHLKVSDLDRSIDFYQRVLGLKLMQRYGPSAAFLSAGGYHHHLGINTWNDRTESRGAGRGLAWFEFVLPDAATLDRVTDRLTDRGHAVDRGGERVFVVDPDGTELRLSTV